MGAHTGIKINALSNLKMSFDISNRDKSWRGGATVNLYDDMGTSETMRPTKAEHFWNGREWIVDSNYTDPGVPGPDNVYLGEVFSFTSGALTSTWSGNSYGYIYKDLSTTANSRYSLSTWCYVTEDSNLTTVHQSIEGIPNSWFSINDLPSSYNLDEKGTWQFYGRGCIADELVRFIPFYPSISGTTAGNFSGKILWAAPQVELAPIPTRYAGYSRSNIEALIDLSGNQNLNVNQLSYGMNSLYEDTFSFNGANSWITGSSNCGITGDVTLAAWIQPTYTSGVHKTIVCTDIAYQQGIKLMNYKNGAKYGLWLSFGGTSDDDSSAWVSANINDGTIHFLAGTWSVNTGIAKLYLDGAETLAANVGNTTPASLNDGIITVGMEYHSASSGSYEGNIFQVWVFDKTLSNDEVLELYKTTRKRYGHS